MIGVLDIDANEEESLPPGRLEIREARGGEQVDEWRLLKPLATPSAAQRLSDAVVLLCHENGGGALNPSLAEGVDAAGDARLDEVEVERAAPLPNWIHA